MRSKVFLILFGWMLGGTVGLAQEISEQMWEFRPNKSYNSGDRIDFSVLTGIRIKRIEMSYHSGRQGAQATLYLDERYISARAVSNTYNGNAGWNSQTDGLSMEGIVNSVSIRFSQNDPYVDSVKIYYDGPVRVEIQTVVQIKYVEVSKRNVYNLAKDIQDDMTIIYNSTARTNYRMFTLQALVLAEELVIASDASPDSDASWLVGDGVKHLLEALDCMDGRAILRELFELTWVDRSIVLRLRTNLAQLREVSNRWDTNPSEWVLSWVAWAHQRGFRPIGVFANPQDQIEPQLPRDPETDGAPAPIRRRPTPPAGEQPPAGDPLPVPQQG